MRLPRSRFSLPLACALLVAACGSAHEAGDDDSASTERDRDDDRGSEGDGRSIDEDEVSSAGGGARDDASVGEDEPDEPGETPIDSGEPGEAARSPEGLIADPEDHVFAQDALRRYEIEVDPDEWAYINETAYLEQYIKGRLTVEGETYEPIGLRFKGFRGSLYNCFDFDENGNSLGRTCSRLSMKVSFDEYDDAGRFYGLKKLNFHAMRNDPSLMRERLSYRLFRAFGVPAPRAVHALVTVNGEDLGLYALVEEIDGTFARARFPDGGKGNIYKERWPTLSADPAYFESGLESNRTDPDLDVSPAVRFAEAVMGASDDTIEAVLREHTQFDALMRYMAVDRAINHWDGPTAFRCQPEEDVPPLPPEVFAAQTPPLGWETCQNKNYFWYEETESDLLWLVSWDVDATFSPFSQFPEWNTEPAECVIEQQGRPPRCDKLINWMATVLRPHYERAGRALLAGPFKPELLQAQADVWYQQIAPFVNIDSVAFGAITLLGAIDARHSAFEADVMGSAAP